MRNRKGKRKLLRLIACVAAIALLCALCSAAAFARPTKPVPIDGGDTSGEEKNEKPIGKITNEEHEAESFFAPRSSKVAGSARLEAPRIDGRRDRFYELCKSKKALNYAFGDETESAEIWAMYDQDFLYLYIDVADPTYACYGEVPTRKDGVELFLNESGHKSVVYEPGDSHYMILRDGSVVCGAGADVERVEYAVVETSAGYAVEIAIEWALPASKRAEAIGFEFRINDSRGQGTRDGILAFNDTSLRTYRDLSRIGSLELR
ncbi:MAG: hypothetical protein IKX54_02735 [Lachnospiraceae bacterium]|nr:hypothetical protein [Lachnospiraceae bacterium]